MNAERFEQFSTAYHAALVAAVSAPDSTYYYKADHAPVVAGKMLAAIAANPFGVNYDGDGFKRACKALGIKYTRKAIIAFINGQ